MTFCASRYHRGVLALLVIFTVLMVGGRLQAQSSSRKSFRAQSDETGSLADCSLRVADDLISVAERKSFRVRPRSQDMSVFQLTGVGLTAAQADTTLDGVSSLLQIDNTDAVVNDVGCCVELRRSGAVTTIGAAGVNGIVVICGGSTVTIPGGVITTGAQLNTVECASGDQAGDAIVVNGLSFCGGVTGNFGGCAASNQAMVMVIGGANSNWAHEFGHVQGLDHVPPCGGGNCNSTAACRCATAGASARNIMFCVRCGGKDTIIAAECSAYRSGASP